MEVQLVKLLELQELREKAWEVIDARKQASG